MKLIAMLMAVLIAFYPVVVPYESAGKHAPSGSLLSEAASGGRKQKNVAAPAEEATEVNTSVETVFVPDIVPPIDMEHEREPVQPEETLTPVHEHTWTQVTQRVHHNPVYQTIHHEAQTESVWIEDKPAWNETYENTRIVAIHAFCKGCGIDLNEAGMTDEEHDEHDRQHILNGEDSSYYEAPIFQTFTEMVHHEAEGHYEDVIVQAAYDETVLVSEAWDEEVIIDYICADCGEVK